MAQYEGLLQFPDSDAASGKKRAGKQQPGTAKSNKLRGCDACPLNTVPGVIKIKNLKEVTGKKVMVWAQNPSELDNRKGSTLVGSAAGYLWDSLSAMGIERRDCDVQNVVRCWPVDVNELDQMEGRPPKKEEIRACSLYNEDALAKNNGNAKVHLVLGAVAAKALLKGEFRKDQKTFFSENLKAWVICTYHPNYFLHEVPESKKIEFQEAIKSVAQKVGQTKGQFDYILSQDYKSVAAKDLNTELRDPILEAAQRGIRISVDIEDDTDDEGNPVLVYIGFSWKKGHSRGVFLNHPQVHQSDDSKKQKMAMVKGILENAEIQKAMQHGSHETEKLRELYGIIIRGYTHDTEYSEYLRFSNRRAFGLEAIADLRFREFAGYKGILDPYKDDTGWIHFRKVPPKTIVVYNGADCDLTKRIERDNKDKVNQELMQVYMRAAIPLAYMEMHGPWLDQDHSELLDGWIPVRVKALHKRLCEIAGNPKFNPKSPPQASEVIYQKLKLGKHLDEQWRKDYPDSTNAETLQLLDKFHEFPGLLQEFRKLFKKEGTYCQGYKKSAELHGGRLRSKWWLTGTITGRLRSGGEKDKSKGIVNLQNVHGDPVIECLLVSDQDWRKLYRDWQKLEGVKNG
jgi:uracil-DNA glycosylase family 4